MFLTNEEERILKGESGVGTQKALELLVAIGDAYDAEKLVPITRAHAAASGQEGDLYFVELLAEGGASAKCLRALTQSMTSNTSTTRSQTFLQMKLK